MIRELTIAEAAEELRLPQATIRKNIKNGELNSTKVPSSGGFRYKVLLDDNDMTKHVRPQRPQTVEELKYRLEAVDANARLNILETQLTANTELIERLHLENEAQATELASRRREVQELHVLLQAAVQTALTAPQNRPWWKLW